MKNSIFIICPPYPLCTSVLQQICYNFLEQKTPNRKCQSICKLNKVRYLDCNIYGYRQEIKIRYMIVNCALYLLQLSSAKKWKNRHLKQCGAEYYHYLKLPSHTSPPSHTVPLYLNSNHYGLYRSTMLNPS